MISRRIQNRPKRWKITEKGMSEIERKIHWGLKEINRKMGWTRKAKEFRTSRQKASGQQFPCPASLKLKDLKK